MLIPKTYPLLQQAIEDGVRYGYRKAFKHTEDPTEKELCDAIEGAAAAQDAADASGKISDVIAAKQAEQARQDTLAAKLDASSDLASTKIADGIRFAWDFDVIDIASVYRAAPQLVHIEIKRSEVLAWFKEMERADVDVAAAATLYGIVAFKKTVVSTR